MCQMCPVRRSVLMNFCWTKKWVVWNSSNVYLSHSDWIQMLYVHSPNSNLMTDFCFKTTIKQNDSVFPAMSMSLFWTKVYKQWCIKWDVKTLAGIARQNKISIHQCKWMLKGKGTLFFNIRSCFLFISYFQIQCLTLSPSLFRQIWLPIQGNLFIPASWVLRLKNGHYHAHIIDY